MIEFLLVCILMAVLGQFGAFFRGVVVTLAAIGCLFLILIAAGNPSVLLAIVLLVLAGIAYLVIMQRMFGKPAAKTVAEDERYWKQVAEEQDRSWIQWNAAQVRRRAALRGSPRSVPNCP